jgi:outer membrane murein-binding lipoprotein Lpp
MDPNSLIALAAIVLSSLTFIATQFGSKRTATAAYVLQLEKRVEALESDLEACSAEKNNLRDQNITLLRRLVLAEGVK